MFLINLNDDTLIYILSFLEPLQLLVVRKTCKRLCALTQSRIVWTNACVYYVVGRGHPFPNVPLDSLPTRKLEEHVCRAAHLATKWLSRCWTPTRRWFVNGTTSTSITDVRILPGSEGNVIFTLSKSVWSVVTVWELEPVISRTASENCDFRKRCDWSPRGAIFNGFTLNSCPSSEAKAAVSVINNGDQTVELLSLKRDKDSGDWSLESIMSISSSFKPITLEGDFLAMSDDFGETIITNWRTNAYATLHRGNDGQSMWQHDNCIQVIFAFQSVLVVRARSLHLFPYPILKQQGKGPLQYTSTARHSFGWVDGVSVRVMGQRLETSETSLPKDHLRQRSLSILVRAETDDPWSSDILTIELYTLYPNPEFTFMDGANSWESASLDEVDGITSPSYSVPTPYIFPPVLTSKVTSLRGALRCTEIILGRLGTAVWIQPRDRSAAGLYWSNYEGPLGPQTFIRSEHMNESLVATAFPGSLSPEPGKTWGDEDDVVETKREVVCWNEQNNWSSMDYDEDVGRIALGSSFGQITIIDL
ncbi:hypothetical protein P691DRAFT_801839 [Macrolepiota fuliginosa MF-IS2]|uniref:F-box domain-containing protein n=1 Tax=Macrolepiota fuliginosa MF-IS2 TaxID=1400762 RepID=A0A9P5XDY6_9AGAR|nr:hypothetical protein P691DRAFT_801839 [Macrolepiota fuliginosa MF-IS2]